MKRFRCDFSWMRVGQLMVILVALCVFPRASAQDPSMIYDGFTEAAHDILVASMDIGLLDKVHVKVGSHVKAGEVIAELETGLQIAALKTARLQATMRGELDATRADRDLQLSRVTKLRTLRDEGMARPDELNRAETDLRIAEAKLAGAEEQSQFRQLELERHELQLARRRIVAPMSGVITEVLHEKGEYISPGDPAIVRLLVTDVIHAVFNIPVEDLAALPVGSQVNVYVRGGAETIASTVTNVSPVIDAESGTVQVRVYLPNLSGRLRVGDRCTMQTISGTSRSASVRSTPPTAEVGTVR